MNIFRRYVSLQLVQITLLVLCALVALFSFFSLIDQLGEAGTGNYGVPQALLYVVLTMPKLAYELFPVAAVIGSMTLLGIMAHNNELDIIRTSGVSSLALAGLLARAALWLLLIALVLGEVITPASEKYAQNMRSVAMTEQISLQTRYGLWMRDGNSFINIRKVLPGERVGEIYVYEFDSGNRLRSSVFAETGEYRDGTWVMRDVRRSIISEQGVRQEHADTARWDFLFSPELISSVVVSPQYMNLWELTDHIRFLRRNQQNSLVQEQALWAKVIKPFSILAMVILAVPLVRGQSRHASIGQRVFVGALVGIAYHLVTEVSSHLGVVYSLPPLLGIATPTLLLYLVIFRLLRR